MTTKHIINCPGCFKNFRKKECYEKHIFKCQRKDIDLIPNNTQLYEIIKDLTEKYNAVQNELETIKRKLNIKNKKIDVLGWLNENNVDINGDFYSCIDNVNINCENLHIIFENGIVNGFVKLILNHVKNTQFIKCFEQKRNILYIFHEKWQIMDDKDFIKIVNTLNVQVFNAFSQYRNENLDKCDDDSFQIDLNNKTKIIMSEIPFNDICTKTKNKLYLSLKECFKNIIEIDVE